MDKEQKDNIGTVLFDLVPDDGESIGNVTLLEKFIKISKEYTPDLYWEIRNSLIEHGSLGKGRGRGGSVYRLQNLKTDNSKLKGVSSKTVNLRIPEKDLYKPFTDTLKDYWAKDNDLKNYIIEITACQGRKDTGGKWTRPDITMVDVKAFSFYPNKILEVITFELKPSDSIGIEGVFETAAHSLFAHKSYLVLHYPKEQYEQDELIETIRTRCEMFGVGLILFKDPNKWDTVTTVLEAKYNSPDPKEVNQFIKQQIKQDNQHCLLEKLK